MANQKVKGQRAEIRKTKSKVKPFSVRYFGKNGELLAPSQTVTTRNNAKKNIVAMINLAGGVHMPVVDLSRKEEKSYLLTDKGMVIEEQ